MVLIKNTLQRLFWTRSFTPHDLLIEKYELFFGFLEYPPKTERFCNSAITRAHCYLLSCCSKMEGLENSQSILSLSEEFEEDRDGSSLSSQDVRSVYLVTYSQADMDKFARREDFASAVVESFSQGRAKVKHWSCCLEEHKDGGLHFHLAIKLDRNQRWISSKTYLLDVYGISVHYSNRHYNYYSAWKYVTKSDACYIESEGHPRLDDTEPQTSSASRSRRQRRKRSRGNTTNSEISSADDDEEDSDGKSTSTRRKKRRRLTAYEVGEIIVQRNVKTLTELQALAFEQKKEGKTDLAEFLVNRNPKVVADVLQTAWEIENAPKKLARSRKSRMDLLEDAKSGSCVTGCHGEWLTCAQQILHNNGISLEFFRTAVKDLLVNGRGKYKNIMLTGPANCGKTFLLNPLTTIYDTFSNPATGTFAWVGVDKAECIFLNDFRWSPQLIPWHDFLLLLEGQTVHLPAPKSHFSKDIAVKSDTPIFCTTKYPILFLKNGVLDQRETEMMKVRWNLFELSYVIPRESQRVISSCGKCFSDLILG